MHVRSLLAVALAALLAGPAAAHAQSKKSSSKAAAPTKASPVSGTTTAPNYSIGGWIGYESGDLSGLQLRGDFIYPYQKLAPKVDLSFVGSVGYSYLTHSESTTVAGVSASADATANVLKFVPAARFSMPVNPQFTLYGDAGLGLYWAGETVKSDIPGGGSVSASNSDVGFMLRLGVGGFYQLNTQVRLGASLVLDPMFGGYSDTTFAFLAGATFRI